MSAVHALQASSLAPVVPMSRAADAALIARWQADEPAAWREVMEAFLPGLKHTAFLVLRCTEDAEEVSLDALRSAHRSLHSFRGTASLRTWLNTIVRNAALNRYHYWRRRGRACTVALEDTPPGFDASLTYASLVIDSSLPVPAAVDLADQERSIAAAVLKLAPHHRTILEHVFAGRSYEEAAHAEGIEFGTCKSRVARARESLRQVLAGKAPIAGRPRGRRRRKISP